MSETVEKVDQLLVNAVTGKVEMAPKVIGAFERSSHPPTETACEFAYGSE